MTHTLTFNCERIDGGTASLMPCIDGIELADLVADFERASGYNDPAGGYGGIVPSHMKLGPLSAYFLGDGPLEQDQIYALFCDCGEAGCWPLIGQVVATDQSVTWENLRQPYRPLRDYSGFGPFVFARPAYEQAVAAAALFAEAS